jgi:hypothetical protein
LRRAIGKFWAPVFPRRYRGGPIVLMIENYRSELLRRLTRQTPYLVSGLRAAGFSGGDAQQLPISRDYLDGSGWARHTFFAVSSAAPLATSC